MKFGVYVQLGPIHLQILDLPFPTTTDVSLPCHIDSSHSNAFLHTKFCRLLLYLVLLLLQFLPPVSASIFSIYERLIHRTFRHYRRSRSLRRFATPPWLQLHARKLFSTQLLSLLHSPCALLPRILFLAPYICNFFRRGALHHRNRVSFLFQFNSWVEGGL